MITHVRQAKTDQDRAVTASGRLEPAPWSRLRCEARRQPTSCRRRGLAVAWVAVTCMTLLAMVGLSLDVAHGLLAGHQLQNAADAAALAGAWHVKNDITLARAAAVQVALANKVVSDPVQLSSNDANAPDGDVVVGRYDRQAGTFDPAATVVNAVQAVARRTSGSLGGSLPLLFGGMFGTSTADVSRSAIAILAGTTGGGVIALCPDCECSIEFSGNTDLILASAPGWEGNTAIQVNSDHDCAMCGDGSSLSLVAPETNIVGHSGDECWAGNPTIDTFINPESPPIPDPLAGLPAPTWGAPNNPNGITNQTVRDGMTTYSPGYYPRGVRLTASGVSATLLPGVYVVDGEGLYINGGSIIAHEVMFYVIGTGDVYLGGNGIIDITPSDDEADPYWGVSIFQARNNTNDATIIGTSSLNLEGTLYFPVAAVEIGGTGTSLGNQFIAWTLRIHGRGEFNIQYDGRFPAPGTKVFIVQ